LAIFVSLFLLPLIVFGVFRHIKVASRPAEREAELAAIS
jgi:hypothetical protein